MRTYATYFETLSGRGVLHRRQIRTRRMEVTGDSIGIALRIGAYYPECMRTISMKLPDDLLSQLEDLARTRRVSKSQVIRESLERALREDSTPGAASCYDLARDLAGALRGLPKDLADNPKYMDGFGQ